MLPRLSHKPIMCGWTSTISNMRHMHRCGSVLTNTRRSLLRKLFTACGIPEIVHLNIAPGPHGGCWIGFRLRNSACTRMRARLTVLFPVSSSCQNVRRAF